MSRTPIRIGIDREGPYVILSARDGSQTATIRLYVRNAAALAASLFWACQPDHLDTSELSADGYLHTQRKDPTP